VARERRLSVRQREDGAPVHVRRREMLEAEFQQALLRGLREIKEAVLLTHDQLENLRGELEEARENPRLFQVLDPAWEPPRDRQLPLPLREEDEL
jgi:hypothetical protein